MKKIWKCASALILTMAVAAACGVATGCNEPEKPPVTEEFTVLTGDNSRDIQYTIMFITNKSYIQAESYLKDFDRLYGEVDPESDRMVGFGLPGPMLINQSIAEIQEEVFGAFRLAKLYNRPVYFNLDDCTAYTGGFGNGSEIKFNENPDMCEWVDFPQLGESYGGERYGALPRWWFNWGSWLNVEAVPCLNSESFLAFMEEKIEKGFLPALTKCYQELIDEGKEYLFAGVSVGWETQIPDYSSTVRNISEVPGMKDYEYSEYGYHALYNLGYTEKSLRREADMLGITPKEHRQNILMGVISDYIEFMAKTVAQCGLIREKIFSHVVALQSTGNYWTGRTTGYPDIETAINEYCIPGWTMNMNTCPYNMDTLIDAIQEKFPGYAEFVNAEGYSRGLNGKLYDNYLDNAEYEQVCRDYFESMFRYKDSSGNVRAAARVVTVYGYDGETSNFGFTKSERYGFVKVTREWLAGEVVKDFDYSAFLAQMRENMAEAQA